MMICLSSSPFAFNSLLAIEMRDWFAKKLSDKIPFLRLRKRARYLGMGFLQKRKAPYVHLLPLSSFKA